MPRTRTKPGIESFGPEYEQLLLRAVEGLKHSHEFAVQFAETSIANSVQIRYRTFVRAIKESDTRPDLAALCADLSTRTAGSALIFFRRADSADCIALREALGLSEGFAESGSTGVLAPSSPLQTNLERLQQIRVAKKQSK